MASRQAIGRVGVGVGPGGKFQYDIA
jgi:hypothetical protein